MKIPDTHTHTLIEEEEEEEEEEWQCHPNAWVLSPSLF